MVVSWPVTEQTEWKHWVTPQAARKEAVHRWFLFPHSYTSGLVFSLIHEWGLNAQDKILDPFVGAGTTMVAAQEKGISATGFDLSPLAVLASNVKTTAHAPERLQALWRVLERTSRNNGQGLVGRSYPDLVRRALPKGRLEQLDSIAQNIVHLDATPAEKDFFHLALIAVIPRFSHAVADGGWLRWQHQGARAELVRNVFHQQVEVMLADICASRFQIQGIWKANVADARSLPETDDSYTAVVSSPPYPNRHDYTRVFGIELMFAFQNWEENRALRYQSFHSHPEARPHRASAEQYAAPTELGAIICQLKDGRIQRMLNGYFLDMYLCLREIERVCCRGARTAFVVGNVRYDSHIIPVDEFTAEIGEQAGLTCKEIRTVRLRGNSAQQMGLYGRMASRESIVIFTK